MDPGTALAVVSLSFQVFAGCVQGFVLLTEAHNLGEDASYLSTMLELEEYRFMQWAEAVGLLAEPQPTLHPRLNQALAAQLMTQLERLISKPVQKLIDRYGLKLSADPPASFSNRSGEANGETAPGIISQTMAPETRRKILARAGLIQKSNSWPKRLWWAAVDKEKLQQLVNDISNIVGGLWALLEPIQQSEATDVLNRVLHRVISLCGEREALKDLRRALLDRQVGAAHESYDLIEITAGLKVCRLDDTLGLKGSTNNDGDRVRVQRGMKLHPHLLRNYQSQSTDSLSGTATYDGQRVWVEHKFVSRALRGKLVSRVERLSELLSQPKDTYFLTLKCLGYFEDLDRFVLVYSFPEERVAATETDPVSLLDLLRSATLKPTVSQRMRIACDLCKTILTIHTSGWLHKDIRSENIIFFLPASSRSEALSTCKPYLTGFFFSRLDSPTEISERPGGLNLARDIYAFPGYVKDPDEAIAFSKRLDLYALSCVLIEIAEWRPLKHLVRKCVEDSEQYAKVLEKVRDWIKENEIENGMLGFRMGDKYALAVSKIFDQTQPVAETSTSPGYEDSTTLWDIVHELGRCRI